MFHFIERRPGGSVIWISCNNHISFNDTQLKSQFLTPLLSFLYFRHPKMPGGGNETTTEGAWWREKYTQSGSTLLLHQIFEFLINQNYVSLLSLRLFSFRVQKVSLVTVERAPALWNEVKGFYFNLSKFHSQVCDSRSPRGYLSSRDVDFNLAIGRSTRISCLRCFLLFFFFFFG